MRFVIQGLKYDTDKMKKIANVKKWYKTNSLLVKAIYGNEEVGTTYDCELWRSEKGNWLLTHTEDYNTKVGNAITEEEAKSLLMRYAPDIYETEVVRIITIIAAVTATGFFTLAALWFIGFLKVRQAWAWLFEDWDRRF